MKLTAKITSIIALILTMAMVLTGCSMVEDIINQLLGTEEPPVVDEPSGYTISAENGDGVLYFSGSVSDGRFNGSYRDKFATLVNLTEVDGGYIIHFFDDDEITQYIVIDDTAAGASLTTDKFQATIFEWNESAQTYVVADDANNRAFGVGKTSTYKTFSCYDVSNTDYNFAKFTPVNDPTIEKGEGGKPTDGNGGNEGGNTGNEGGNTGNEGGNTGNEGGNTGNEGGNTGNEGGNTDNPFANGFELGLVPAYNSSFGGYYVINNNNPYFTAEEISTAKSGCFEYYAERDSLGRATLACACVCNNTRPADSRGDISSVKPTGWVQKTYDIIPGNHYLYNRSHLIAWSLTDEDANWENLVTGAVHMNQNVMTQFETQVLSYIKASNSNKVLYRATPVYNGNNLVCTGILLEAYSINDNGDDICFCVFIYNVQPGISINYANGQSELGDEAGKNSGLAGSIVNGGNTGGNIGDIEDTDIPNNTITDNKVNITVDTLGIPSKSYDTGKAMFSGTELQFIQIGNYGDGVQMRDKDGNTSIIWNNTALPGTIARIELTYSSTKDVSYSNPDSVIFSFGNSKDSLTYVTKLSTTAGTKTYTITPDGDYTFFKMEHDLGFSFYWNSIVIILADGAEIPGGGTTTPDPDEHACESKCDDCGKCKDAACNESVCLDKCQGHQTVTPGTSTNVTFELGTNGNAAHKDGDNNIADASYTETVDGYTLNITSNDKMYIGAIDAQGNSCLKLGTTSVAGDISFTVSEDVTSVVISIAKYKNKTSKITVNGTSYTLTKNSDDGQYDEIVIDTSVTKTVNLTTVSGGYRAMINAIVFVVEE